MVTHDEIRDELLRRLDAKHHKAKDVAALLGIAPPRISEIRRGERMIQQDEMVTLAKLFGMGEVESDHRDDFEWVPVIGIAAAGAWREAINLPHYSVPILKKPGRKAAFAVEVKGDSMDKILPDGSWAAVDPTQKTLFERKVYLIQNGDGEATIKRFMEAPARFEPASNNPDHQPIMMGEHQIIVIGRVVSWGSDEGL
ncbi:MULTISPECIES: XRE family transcriptional regulator [unclassified Novosphingobium]|nr:MULTISPECIES: XRE family transcriptional regulator [unclassified Novosphingobium]PTR05127.1 repressor LexA [Novosphingobium sp. GV055]PUA93743.1 repressor LexA [Novosphingobium sp. GV061]PUB10283.1 repressor LexA [Novosphingobium sp. GV079]PUB36446.1 repressor LexA [Novosphingobium sp. GV027]